MHTVRGTPSTRETADRLRPHVDPDRARLPDRPLLQPLRLPRAGAVHLPALRPARRRLTDFFGTASGGIDFTVISANAIWYVQVGALVIGHVLGLALAHDRALVYWTDYRDATRSQYWMLALMVAFTCFGLFLLSAGNG